MFSLVTMEIEREVEARLAKEREYSDLKALVLREFGRPTSRKC